MYQTLFLTISTLIQQYYYYIPILQMKKEMQSSILFLWIIETSDILWRAITTKSEFLSFRTLLKYFSLSSTSFKGCPVTHTTLLSEVLILDPYEVI